MGKLWGWGDWLLASQPAMLFRMSCFSSGVHERGAVGYYLQGVGVMLEVYSQMDIGVTMVEWALVCVSPSLIKDLSGRRQQQWKIHHKRTKGKNLKWESSLLSHFPGEIMKHTEISDNDVIFNFRFVRASNVYAKSKHNL